MLSLVIVIRRLRIIRNNDNAHATNGTITKLGNGNDNTTTTNTDNNTWLYTHIDFVETDTDDDTSNAPLQS